MSGWIDRGMNWYLSFTDKKTEKQRGGPVPKGIEPARD